MSADTKTAPTTQQVHFNDKPRHIVEFDSAAGCYKDHALCGALWERMGLPDTGKVCPECDKLFKEMFGA